MVRDVDEVSCIEISTLQRDDVEFAPEELAEFSADLRDNGHSGMSVRLGPWRGDYYQYIDGDEAIREWFLGHGDMMLFITCSCLADHAGIDDSAVDAILQTLTPL